MLDDQFGPKIVILAPADVARLPPSIIKKLIVHSLVYQLGIWINGGMSNN
jgi:hypothetical protein